MAQDLSHGRRTEIREINGEIIRRATHWGIPTPGNAALLAAVEAAGG